MWGCVWMVTACASQTPLLPDRAPLPPSLLTPCPNLPELADGSGEAILRTLVDVAQLYYECQDRHEALATAVQLSTPPR